MNRHLGVVGLLTGLGIAAFLATQPVHATTLFQEDFSGATPGEYGVGTIPGTQFAVTGSSVDVFGQLNGSFFSCANNPGGNCLDLVSGSGKGSIQSIPTFDLQKGKTYKLTFGEVLQGFSAGSTAFTTFDVALGSQSQKLKAFGGLKISYTLSFLAATNETDAALSFTTLTAPDSSHGAVLDNIVLSNNVSPVPLPASLPLTAAAIAGLAGLGILRRKS